MVAGINNQLDSLAAVLPINAEASETNFSILDGFVNHKIVVLIPAHNEERFIGSVIIKARKYTDTIIVIDDGSTDGTAEVAEAAGAEVLRHEVNQGKGVALNTGFSRARVLNPCVVVTIDGDGQHMVDEIPQVILPVLNDCADIVVGSRYLEMKSEVPIHRVWGHRIFNFVSTQASGIPITDSQSGFRAFSSRALSVINFSSNGFSVESEMQLLAREHHLRVDEVSITIQYLDKPKRSVITQGMAVMTGILRLVGQYRPLLFFGVPGSALIVVGLVWGLLGIDIYRRFQTYPFGSIFGSTLAVTLGALAVFTGVVLHSVRGLLLDLVHPRG